MAFIEIEGGTNIVLDVFAEDETGLLTEITQEQQMEIATSEFGHVQFVYVDGNLIENTTLIADLRLRRRRTKASLPRMEFMLALDDADLLTAAADLVAAPETPPRIKIMWEHAGVFNRMHPELVQMATALGLTDAQMDAVFGIIA